jgi:hypothetical protein
MSKPPSTVKECVAELVNYIEHTGDIVYEKNIKAKARMLDLLRTELLAYRKLRDWIMEEDHV